MKTILLLVVDVGAGLLLAGAVAPLVLVLLPVALRGRVFLAVTCVVCIGLASLIRHHARRRR